MLSLRTRQVAGVTLIVGLSVVVLSAIHLARIARTSLDQGLARGELLAKTIFQQATVVARDADSYAALREDPGIRSILQSGMAYSRNVTYAAIVDPDHVAIAHSSPVLEGEVLPEPALLESLIARGPIAQLRAIYSDRTFEVRERLLMGDRDFGSIRIGLSMLLVREEIEAALRPAAMTAAAALIVATLVAMLFARWMLRPIHVVSSGLTRLGRGEFDVKLDLPPGEEFADLGRSFDSVSAELTSVRSRLAGQPAHFESIVDRLEDAVAIAGPGGALLFVNPAMRAMLGFDPAPEPNRRVPAGHPYQRVLEPALAARASRGPMPVMVTTPDGSEVEHLVAAHGIEDSDGRFVGVMLVARNLAYLSQVQSTLRYSRKLAALGRLLAGVAHEVKNPLNAMAIHLELMKQKLMRGAPRRDAGADPDPAPAAGEGDPDGAARGPSAAEVASVLKHATVIGGEIRRLDDVVQGFLKFSRPDEIDLQPVALAALVDEVAGVLGPDAAARSVTVRTDCPADLPLVSGDPIMLRQALLNLALNGCQAMPGGGTLVFTARRTDGGLVEISVSDTGVGIPPEHLDQIFDLYFTTREGGSGIGLSMVYRTVQLHDGAIEVESTPGAGTTVRVRLPQARAAGSVGPPAGAMGRG
jgi:PAS domain S-box-containing protein